MTSRAKRSGRIAPASRERAPCSRSPSGRAGRTARGDGDGRLAAVQLDHAVEAAVQLVHQLGGPQHAGVLLVADRPGEHQAGDRVGGAEDAPAVLGIRQGAVAAEVALHVPGDPVGDPDLRRPPRRRRAATGCGSRTRAGRSPPGAGSRARPWWRRPPCHGCARAGRRAGAALVGEPDEVELAALEEQLVRVDDARGRLAGLHRVVLELDPLAAVDRRVELGQAGRQLAAAGRAGDAEPDRALRGRAERAGAAPGELLEREPQRLRVRELPVQEAQGGLQGGELAVGEGDGGQEEGLGRERVVLLLGEAVGGLVHGQVDAERVELGAVGVEAARERVLRHVGVALDVAADLRRRDGPALGHQVGDQRQLPDQLLGVLRHGRTR